MPSRLIATGPPPNPDLHLQVDQRVEQDGDRMRRGMGVGPGAGGLRPGPGPAADRAFRGPRAATDADSDVG